MTREEVKAHMDMLIAHKDKAIETHPYFNGATNGDVMQAIFPRTKFYKNLTYIYTEQDKVICDLDWWDTPYREGDAE